MKVLIAGGAGFIGSNLCDYLIQKQASITVIDNLITGQKNNIKHLLDRCDFQFIEDGICHYNFSTLKPFDLIYHLASPASPIQYKKHAIETLRANSIGTEKLLEFQIRSKSKTFILASTSEVYGDPLIHPQPESYWGNVNPVGIRACYDESKRYAEALAINYHRKYHVDVRIARIFNTYGPRMEKNDGRVVSNFIMQALLQQPITVYGTGKQTRSFCYVDDMVKALYLFGSTNNLAGQIINLGNPEEKKIRELALIIRELTNSTATIVGEPIDGDDPKQRCPDIGKAKKLLNWSPQIGLKDGLKKAISYFKENYL